MEHITKGNYSFTFVIPSQKVVYFQNNRLPYNKLRQELQYEFIESHLQKINKFHNVKWVYEEHNDDTKRLHVHGYVMDTSYEEMEDFRRRFYSHPIQLAYSGYIKVSNIQKSLVDIQYFLNYMNKHQSTIKYFMLSDQQKLLSNNIDGKKTDFTENFKINAQYFNSLGEHLENEYLGDTYNFGKSKLKIYHNKYIIEL